MDKDCVFCYLRNTISAIVQHKQVISNIHEEIMHALEDRLRNLNKSNTFKESVGVSIWKLLPEFIKIDMPLDSCKSSQRVPHLEIHGYRRVAFCNGKVQEKCFPWITEHRSRQNGLTRRYICFQRLQSGFFTFSQTGVEQKHNFCEKHTNVDDDICITNVVLAVK